MRQWTKVVLLLAVVVGASPERSEAACNTVPQLFASPQPTPRFCGALGGAGRPFVEPAGPIILGQAGCEPKPAPTMPPADAATVTMIFKPNAAEPDGKVAALIIRKDCKEDVDVAKCKNALPKNGAARCAPSGSLEASQARDVLRLQAPMVNDLIRRGGSLVVAVTAGDEPPCALGTKTCEEWLATKPGGAYVCVDRFKPDTSKKLPAIAALTALPDPNDFRSLCWKSKNGLCDASGSTVRYTLDDEDNLLIPVLWWRLFPNDGNAPPARNVYGGTVLPAPFKIVDANRTLQSLAPEGEPLSPIFDVTNNPRDDVLALEGTTDGYYSVLRLPGGRCRGTDRSCFVAGDCTNGTPCDHTHELRKHLDVGETVLDHGSLKMCQDEPDYDCTVFGTGKHCGYLSGNCVGYAMVADHRTPAPAPARTPDRAPDAQAVRKAVLDALGPDSDPTIRVSDGWVSVIANVNGKVRARRAAAALVGPRRLLVTRLQDLVPQQRAASSTVPAPACAPDIATFAIVRGLDGKALTVRRHELYGRQTRFIEDDAIAIQGLGAAPAASDRLLWIYDAPTCTSSLIAIVDPEDGERDPLRELTNGSVRFTTPGGRCVASGVELPVPSACRPFASRDCPRGATCEPRRIVVATSLSGTDAEGIPNAAALTVRRR